MNFFFFFFDVIPWKSYAHARNTFHMSPSPLEFINYLQDMAAHLSSRSTPYLTAFAFKYENCLTINVTRSLLALPNETKMEKYLQSVYKNQSHYCQVKK